MRARRFELLSRRIGSHGVIGVAVLGLSAPSNEKGKDNGDESDEDISSVQPALNIIQWPAFRNRGMRFSVGNADDIADIRLPAIWRTPLASRTEHAAGGGVFILHVAVVLAVQRRNGATGLPP